MEGMERAPGDRGFFIPKKGSRKEVSKIATMTNKALPKNQTPDRLRGYLSFFTKRYPDAWKHFETFPVCHLCARSVP